MTNKPQEQARHTAQGVAQAAGKITRETALAMVAEALDKAADKIEALAQEACANGWDGEARVLRQAGGAVCLEARQAWNRVNGI